MDRFSQSLSFSFRPQRIAYHVFFKLLALFRRTIAVLQWFPMRLRRLIEHFGNGVRWIDSRLRQPLHPLKMLSQIGFWWLELLLFVLDVVGLGEWYEILCDWLKPNTRSLTKWELEEAQKVFGNSIDYWRIRIDSSAFLGPVQMHVCYVGFYTINSWGSMHNSLLIHELMHVWQYQHWGMVYIPRALAGMWSPEGYNYGGVGRLREIRDAGKGLEVFNPEQQADIIADYYRLYHGYQPRWGMANAADLPVYEYFAEQLQE